MKNVIIVCVLLVGMAQAGETVTIESLLHDMINRDAVARFPAQDFRLKQHSSYNRASKTPDDARGWFTNHDYNSGDRDKNFMRIEEVNGQREWVLMDHQGAGAMVRIWMPWRNQKSAETSTTIRIYLDGAQEPTLEGNMLGLFDGTGLIPYPLAHPSLRSAVSFFPIPYAKRCKVTVTERPFFFQLTFREYAKGTPVKTFTMADFEAAKGLTKKVGDILLNPKRRVEGVSLAYATTLDQNQEKTLVLPTGASAVRELTVKLGSYEDPSVTRSVVLKMEFDGKETVWCPVGDFFGTGIGLNPFQGWYRTVHEDGTMTCRWVMPYQSNGKVTLVNLGEQSADAALAVQVGDWQWDDRSLYFHAAWRGQYPVPTMPRSDWNYVTLKGRGVYVGDTLTIMNPVEKWWGEGDERIWVDGEDFPSIFGTGTEDYYAYSWGGRSTDFYEHPFHAQPFCHVYNKLNRKTDVNERNAQGYSTETRTRALDTMPFGSSLQLDMEVWSGTDCDMGYGVGVYWYGDAHTTSNRRPDPEGAIQVPPLPAMSRHSADPTPASASSHEKNMGPSEPPNVVIIFADDLGYGDLGCYGATKVQTPNIDQLAAEGRRFTDAHSASAVCTPSRYALLTGEYPHRKGLTRPVFLRTGLIISTIQQTLASIMKDTGYATACVGKWHLGFGEKQPDWNGELKPGPLELGFDYYYGVPVVNSHPPFVYVENHRVVGLVPDDPFVYGKKAKTKEYREKMKIDEIGGADAAHALYDDDAVGTVLTEKAVSWIKKQKGNRFFLYFATTNIHHPFTPAPRFKGTSQCGLYGDFIHELDWIVGEVMKTLETQGVAKNTLVIFTSDNGGMFNMGGQEAWQAGHWANGDLLGYKFSAWEGGHRVPFIARWPGKIEAGSTSNEVISNVDMLATMAALTGASIKQRQARDSVNVLPALIGNPAKQLRDEIVLAAFKPSHLGIRKGKWMYIGAQGGGGFSARTPGAHAFGGPAACLFTGRENSDIENGRIKEDAPPAQLYDLENDLSQTKNLYREYPEVVKEMKALLEASRN